MGIFIILALMFFMGIPFRSNDLLKTDRDMFGWLLMIFGGCGFCLSLLLVFVFQASGRSQVQQYYAMKDTIVEARKDASDIELAALTRKIIEANCIIATAKYWNDSFWVDAFVADELAELEPLK